MSEIKTDIVSILKIALPISVGTLVQFLVLLTDNYFLSRVGESAINGAGNAGLTYLTTELDMSQWSWKTYFREETLLLL